MKKVFLRSTAASTHTTRIAGVRDPARLSDSPDDPARNSPGSAENDWNGSAGDPRESAENSAFNLPMNAVQGGIYGRQAPANKYGGKTILPVPMCRDRIDWVAKRPVGPQRESHLSLEQSSNATTGTARSIPGECHG